jgi:hypothetical protein
VDLAVNSLVDVLMSRREGGELMSTKKRKIEKAPIFPIEIGYWYP